MVSFQAASAFLPHPFMLSDGRLAVKALAGGKDEGRNKDRIKGRERAIFQ